MKKYIPWLLLAIVAIGILLLSTTIRSRNSRESAMVSKIGRLPPAVFTTLLGTPFNLADLKKNNPLLIVYFSPGCEHCQHSARELYRYRDQLKNASVIMIARETKNEVAAFATRYQIDQMGNLLLLLNNNEQAHDMLGLDNVPSYLLYDAQQRLIKKIVGNATMESIINTLQRQGDAISKKAS